VTLLFSPEAFQCELKTRRFGRACRAVAETGSTIDLAWEWLGADGPEGGVVIADRQTRGRGRLGREWASPEGGLWMSVLARPDIPIDWGGRLGVMMALDAAAAVSAVTGCAARVRWPNDLLISGRKVGGVLIDARPEGGRLTAAILSFGLNVNVPINTLPETMRGTAATLLAETGRIHRIEVVAARILEALERDWPLLLAASPGLPERWGVFDAIPGAEVLTDIAGEALQGQNAGIDEEGALILKTAGGPRRITSGEVHLLRPAAV